MAAVTDQQPEALGVVCPTCERPPLARCVGEFGRQVPVHADRRRAAGLASPPPPPHQALAGREVECPECGWTVRLTKHGNVPWHLPRRVGPKGPYPVKGPRCEGTGVYPDLQECDRAGEVPRG